MKRERNKEEQKERRSTPHLLPIPTYGSSFTFYFSLLLSTVTPRFLDTVGGGNR
jgi:hypothetical protein